MKYSDIGIENDMPYGWLYDKRFPYRLKIHCMWYDMWCRIYGTDDAKLKYYKDVTVDDSWRKLSNYNKFIESCSSFSDFKINYKDYCMDKDIKYPGNRHYGPNTCTLTTKTINAVEVRKRDKNHKSIIGLSNKNPKIYVFCPIRQSDNFGFCSSSLVKCAKGKKSHHKGYKWYYLITIEL